MSEASYEAETIDLFAHVERPSYEAVLDWMKAAEGPHVSFDFWARGNFTRRLIYHRKLGLSPLLVKIRNVDEMRWAFRRLALFDVAVDFVYCGPLARPGSVLHLCPWDTPLNAGWGYIAALGSKATIKGREWFPVLGSARLMPQSVVDWLIDEAAAEFLNGKVFLAPAELIGIDPLGSPEGLSHLAIVADGPAFTTDFSIARAAVNIDLPFLDRMAPDQFHVFLADHGDALVDLRRAFRKLFAGGVASEAEFAACVEEIRHEVNELTEARKSERVRGALTMLGGTFGIVTVSISLGLALQEPRIGQVVAASAAAGQVLVDLIRQAREKASPGKSNPYTVLWKLGMAPATKRGGPSRDLVRDPTLPSSDFDPTRPYHWLCPPTWGLLYPSVAADNRA